MVKENKTCVAVSDVLKGEVRSKSADDFLREVIFNLAKLDWSEVEKSFLRHFPEFKIGWEDR